MGVGDPLEAGYTLSGPIAAGNWHLVGDGIVLHSVDMQFDVIWRSGGADQVVASFQHHFDEPPDANAVALDADAQGDAVPSVKGDQLILRFTASGAAAGPAFIPNADGPHAHGRIPALTHPDFL